MTNEYPSFIQGQQAWRDGNSKDANPFEPKILNGDDYPGPWANWNAGWQFAKMVESAGK